MKMYIKNVVAKYEDLLGRTLKEYRVPMESSYHPSTDESEPLEQKELSVFYGLIGSANWLITLGRFDVHYATNALSHFSMAPRRGHLEAMIRVFGYLKKFPHGQLLVDPNPIDHTEIRKKINKFDWQEFYPDVEEEKPPDMLPVKGAEAFMTCYVDADHAHDLVTRRSITGSLFMVNGMPIKWISNCQKTVETSTYGSV